MSTSFRSLHASSAVSAVALVLVTACQATTRAEVAGTSAAGSAGNDHQHAPGMAHDTMPARASGPVAAGAMMQMDPDTRFLHHMIGHHAQALLMTELVPSRAGSAGIKLLAERIDISQKDEVSLMRRLLQQRGKPLPDDGEHAEHMRGMAMPGMLTDAEMARLSAVTGTAFERLFLELMIKHHQGALTMVRELLGSQGAGQDSEMFRLVADIDADQRSEIARMQSMLDSLSARPPG